MLDAALLDLSRAVVTAKTMTKKFMNESIVSAEAKARLTEAVKNYAPPAPEKYRALEEVKDCIAELRNKKASYQTIRTILKDNAGIEVSHQTIARYCREVLESAKPKKPRRPKTPVAEQPAPTQTEPQSRPHIGYPRPRGPHIADSKNL
jgi:IS30 family transposase